ncbi:HD-domain/PDEase-like protein [Ramicandelaber brevisporus]|nr:HD-domain/PDEase-like protein [Ramicandelaber brevisporus]
MLCPKNRTLSSNELIAVEKMMLTAFERRRSQLGMNFDAFAWSNADLLGILLAMFLDAGVMDTLQLDASSMLDFALDVQAHYLAVPYHSFLHGVDVVVKLHHVMITLGTAQYLSRYDVAATMIAALCHDIGHPGFNNAYHVHTKHDLAQRYNNKSVLERYSCDITADLIKKHDLLRNLVGVYDEEYLGSLYTSPFTSPNRVVLSPDHKSTVGNTSEPQAQSSLDPLLSVSSAQQHYRPLQQQQQQQPQQQRFGQALAPPSPAVSASVRKRRAVTEAASSPGPTSGGALPATGFMFKRFADVASKFSESITESILHTDMDFHFGVAAQCEQLVEHIALQQESLCDSDDDDDDDDGDTIGGGGSDSEQSADDVGVQIPARNDNKRHVCQRCTSLNTATPIPVPSGHDCRANGHSIHHHNVSNGHTTTSTPVSSTVSASSTLTAGTFSLGVHVAAAHRSDSVASAGSSATGSQIAVLTIAQRQMLCNDLLHAVDVFNTALPWPLCKKWSDVMIIEFFNQGDKEKEHGIQVSPGMDREVSSQANINIKFSTVLVRPFFKTIAELIPDKDNGILENLDKNLEHWMAHLKESEEAQKGKAAESATTAPAPDEQSPAQQQQQHQQHQQHTPQQQHQNMPQQQHLYQHHQYQPQPQPHHPQYSQSSRAHSDGLIPSFSLPSVCDIYSLTGGNGSRRLSMAAGSIELPPERKPLCATRRHSFSGGSGDGSSDRVGLVPTTDSGSAMAAVMDHSLGLLNLSLNKKHHHHHHHGHGHHSHQNQLQQQQQPSSLGRSDSLRRRIHGMGSVSFTPEYKPASGIKLLRSASGSLFTGHERLLRRTMGSESTVVTKGTSTTTHIGMTGASSALAASAFMWQPADISTSTSTHLETIPDTPGGTNSATEP